MNKQIVQLKIKGMLLLNKGNSLKYLYIGGDLKKEDAFIVINGDRDYQIGWKSNWIGIDITKSEFIIVTDIFSGLI